MTIVVCIPNCDSRIGDWAGWALGPAYVSAALKAAGHHVINVNFILEERSVHESLFDIMQNNKIDVVAVGDIAPHWERVKEIADAAKEIDTNVTTIIGGGLVTHSPFEAMEIIPSADYGVIGEGEITECELVAALENKNDVSKVPGIVYRTWNPEGVLLSPPREDIPDLDTIPFPDYDGFRFGELLTDGCASIVTSRSCPFSCTYCTHSGGKSFRMRSLDGVFEEIEMLVQKYSITRLNLNDELFTIKPERLYEFCERIKPYNLSWRTSLRISDNLTLDLLHKMRDSGCVMILFGLESADDRILKSMRKGITVAQIERCLELAKEAGIDVSGNFIFGDPIETMDTVNNTLEWVNLHRNLLMHINLTPISIYPGSKLYDDAIRDGKIKNPIEHIKGGCKPFNCSQLTDDQYLQLIGERLPKELEHSLQTETSLSFIPKPKSDEYTVKWTCQHCGEQCSCDIKSDNVYKTRIYDFICTKCGQTATAILALEYCRQIRVTFNRIVSENPMGKIALWGTGWFLRSLFMQVPELKDFIPDDAPFILCDMQSRKQGLLVFGHKVYTPAEVLSRPDVKLCIITNMFYEDVKRTIAQKYPQIKAIAIHEIGMLQNIDLTIEGESL